MTQTPPGQPSRRDGTGPSSGLEQPTVTPCCPGPHPRTAGLHYQNIISGPFLLQFVKTVPTIVNRHDRNAVTRADVLHLFLTRTEKLSRAAMTVNQTLSQPILHLSQVVMHTYTNRSPNLSE